MEGDNLNIISEQTQIVPVQFLEPGQFPEHLKTIGAYGIRAEIADKKIKSVLVADHLLFIEFEENGNIQEEN